jgi:hypothetical protein
VREEVVMVDVRLEESWTDRYGIRHAAGETVDVDAVTLAELQARGVAADPDGGGGETGSRPGPTGDDDEGEIESWPGPTGDDDEGEIESWPGPTGDDDEGEIESWPGPTGDHD